MSTSDPAHNGFQYVAVPTVHLPAVYRLLAELSEAPSAAPPTVANAASTEDAKWTAEDLTRFARGSTKTTELAGQIFDVLVDVREEDALTLDELAERTGLPRSQVKTLWTHVARHLGKHYATSRPPMSTKWGSEFTPQRDNVVYYFMTPHQAQVWQDARAAA